MSKRKLIKMQSEIDTLNQSSKSQMHMLINLIEMVKNNKLTIDRQAEQLAALSGCVAVPPPVEPKLSGNDLCRAMLDRGDKLVLCSVSDDGTYTAYDAICSYDDDYDGFEGATTYWSHVVPVNNQGEPLAAKDVGL